jgi:hypothetical protein
MAVWSSSSRSIGSKTAILNLLIRVALAFSTLQTSFALFSQPTRWPQGTVSVQRNSAGTFCYLPVANAVREVTCRGAASDFGSVLDVHLNQGLSIAHYNGIDNVLLGGANYSLPVGANMPIIRLCVSGRAGDGYYYETICMNALADNTLWAPTYCQVAVGQKQVTDGCYEPNVVRTGPTGSSVRTSGGAIYTPSSGGPYTSKSAIPARFCIASGSIFVAVVVIRTLLQL